jgi:Flp pilus assembly CpaE family ATPase
MTSASQIFVALEEGIDEGPIQEAFPAGVPVRIVSLAEAADQGFAELQAAADLVVVGCAGLSDQAVRLIEAAARQRPDRPVVALYEGTPNGFMQRAFEAGADDLIALPQQPSQLRFSLEKALARRRGSTVGTAAPMITVLGPKGGTGKTLTSCNLAVSLAQLGASAVVVDLDLQFGDVGLALGLTPERTIYDLATSGGSLDAEKVDGFLAEHPSGARALLAPVRPDQAAAIEPSFLRQVYELLRAQHDFVIVDTPPAFTPEVIATIDASSHLCLVGMLDALSLKDTKIGLETLAQMGYDPHVFTLVLNRADTNVGISRSDVERLLGRAPDVLVPSDRAIPRAITLGEPIVVAEPRSGAAKAFATLASRYVDAPGATSAPAPENGNGRRRALLRRGA